MPDEGSATGYIPDEVYQDALARIAAADEDAAGMLELSRIQVDEAGESQLELLSATRTVDELDETEAALRDIDACVRAPA